MARVIKWHFDVYFLLSKVIKLFVCIHHNTIERHLKPLFVFYFDESKKKICEVYFHYVMFPLQYYERVSHKSQRIFPFSSSNSVHYSGNRDAIYKNTAYVFLTFQTNCNKFEENRFNLSLYCYNKILQVQPFLGKVIYLCLKFSSRYQCYCHKSTTSSFILTKFSLENDD